MERKVSIEIERVENKPPIGDLKSIRRCYTCGTCSSGCPVKEVRPEFDPRIILRLILLGKTEDLIKSQLPWLCTGCYTCEERCPQEIPVTHIITELKHLCYQKNFTPQGPVKQKELIIINGKIYPLDDFDNKKRKKAGLPPLPTALKEISLLLEERSSDI